MEEAPGRAIAAIGAMVERMVAAAIRSHERRCHAANRAGVQWGARVQACWRDELRAQLAIALGALEECGRILDRL